MISVFNAFQLPSAYLYNYTDYHLFMIIIITLFDGILVNIYYDMCLECSLYLVHTVTIGSRAVMLTDSRVNSNCTIKHEGNCTLIGDII
jgi:hypothetical protein